MAQPLVREIAESLVRKLKSRARAHGVSAEEEHRRILREALSRPEPRKPTLVEFLFSKDGVVNPDIELDLGRSRDAGDRDIGM